MLFKVIKGFAYYTENGVNFRIQKKKIPSSKSQKPNSKELSQMAWSDKFTGIFWNLVPMHRDDFWDLDLIY
jgi:hypothetical protein